VVVSLRGPDDVQLGIHYVVRLDSWPLPNVLDARVIAYAYRLSLVSAHQQREIIGFHWTPSAPPPQRRHSHLHVGSLVTSGSPFHGGDFNKLHIPTGPLSMEAVLLFAVEELGVEPAPGRDRETVIDQLRAGDRPPTENPDPLD